MRRLGRGGSAVVGVLGAAVFFIVGIAPVSFIDSGRRAGSLGKVDLLGLQVTAAVVVVIAVSAGLLLYRVARAGEAPAADLWVALFLAVVTWSVGVFTLVPGLVFLRLSDNRSLNDHGATFLLEWAFVYLLIAAAALALGCWSLRSLAKVGDRPSGADTVTSS
jgi:hypothetical protein